jgi:hypothetical protein
MELSPEPSSAVAHLLAQDRQLARLRDRYRARRIQKRPWGWEAYVPGRVADDEDAIQAKTLDELEARLGGTT